jgi:hypothetical protein
MIEIPYPFPQVALTTWIMFSMLRHIFKNGEARPPSNFYWTAAAFLAELVMLVNTGFFVLGLRWPHLLWAALSGVGLVGAAVNHDRPRPAYNAVSSVVASLICFSIYYAGGLYGHY